MRESEIQKRIMDYLKDKDYFVWKNHMEGVRAKSGGGRGRNPNAGIPDLMAMKDGELLFFEVKGARGRLSPAQKDWHDEAKRNGFIVHVVYSLDDVIDIVGV